jgi:deoxyribose-phosphate aldolase
MITHLSKKELAKRIDHSKLKPNFTRVDIESGCEEAVEYGCAALCVNPTMVEIAYAKLKGTGVLVNSVVGFPFGATLSDIKSEETRQVIAAGAGEIDMVIDVASAIDGNWAKVKKDVMAVVEAADQVPVKTILETCFLNDDQIINACKAATEAGAAYVKTSTGFADLGATIHDIILMRKSAGSHVKIKAAGGINYYEDAIAMINAGADRIGVSATARILSDAPSD